MFNFEEKQISTDEGSVSYWTRHGDGPVLILIPGSFNDRFCWKSVIDKLDQNTKIVIIEIRGHGNSWPPPANGTIEQFAEDSTQIIKHLGIHNFFIAGHSIGGMIALQTASLHPTETLGVISVEGWTNSKAVKAFNGDMKGTLTTDQEKEFNMLRESIHKRWSKEEIARFTRIFTKWDGYPFLETTDIPILEIYGDRGKQTPSLSELFIPKRENIRVEWIKNCSHNLMLENPYELSRLMRSFMNEKGMSK